MRSLTTKPLLETLSSVGPAQLAKFQLHYTVISNLALAVFRQWLDPWTGLWDLKAEIHQSALKQCRCLYCICTALTCYCVVSSTLTLKAFPHMWVFVDQCLHLYLWAELCESLLEGSGGEGRENICFCCVQSPFVSGLHGALWCGDWAVWCLLNNRIRSMLWNILYTEHTVVFLNK